jgi:hypothetical protein
MANVTIRTPEKAEVLLAALRERPVYGAACRKARISRNAFNEWRRDDPEFNRRVLAARDEGDDAIEDALATRALKDDTTAAIFLMKSRRRETYGDRIDHTHRGMITFDPEWIAIRSAILDVLAPHPEILNQLVGRLAALGAGDE